MPPGLIVGMLAAGLAGAEADALVDRARLHELVGDLARARDAYERVRVDHPGSQAAARAGVGGARVLLREGRCGAAARLLQEAIEAEIPGDSLAAPLRELAVRCLLRPTLTRGSPSRIGTDVRSVDGFFPTTTGGVLIAVNRDDRVTLLTPDGQAAMTWELPGLAAVTVDPGGGWLAVAGEFVYRLNADGTTLRGAALGDYAPVSALAADGNGALWVADRRGERIGRIAPGGSAAEAFWEDREARLVALTWDGQRLVGLDEKGKRLLTFARDGSVGTIPLAGSLRPVGLAADPVGGLVVLDTRLDQVELLSPDGSSRGVVTCSGQGVTKPLAVGLGFDGMLHLFDGASGEWVRFP